MKFITLFILAAFCLDVTGQVTVYDKDNPSANETIPNGKKSWSGNSSVFKVKLDLEEALLNGSAAVYVEKNFSDLFGLEFGAGITYMSLINYYMYDVSSRGSSKSMPSVFFGKAESTSISGISPNDVSMIPSENLQYKPGFMVSVFPKIYLEEDPTDGYFIGLNAVYKNFNFSTPSVENTSQISQSFNKLNLSVNIGNCIEVSDRFVIETFTGLGVSFVSDLRNGSYYDGMRQRDIKVKYSPVRMHLQFGSRFCFIF